MARLPSALACLLLAIPCGKALAQDCPGPLKIVVGLAAGGGTDNVARTIAQRYTARFGQKVIVENRVGASGNIATEYVAKAPRDGCTLVLKGNEHFVNALVYSRPGYQPKDLTPVVHAVNGPVVVVANPSLPFDTLPGLVDYAKAHPGRLAYASSGVGSSTHVATELFTRAARIDVVHVPYRGAAPSLSDVAGGAIPLATVSVSAALPFVVSGRVRALGVSGNMRWPALPGVPTQAEAGYPGATYWYWMGLLAPAGTPAPVREKLNQRFRAVLEEPQVREHLQGLGYLAVGGSIAEFEKTLQADEQVERRLVQELNIRLD
jgi:tripartite-type tricarboxylate transporter receptor subunit TctC